MLQRVEHFAVVLIGLVAELVAKNTNTGHSSGLGNFIHCREVRCGRASQGRNVLQKNNLALIGIEFYVLTREVLQ